ncbi:MAG: hypothetical protein K0S47_2942 [Herbinix sp.]|jgi:uncharacterized membrane protein YjjB (DUF3815 family)|nr:hypothetical protein [Herbinix sp.]
MIIQLIVSFIATIAFSVLFSVPRKEYLFCGICGVISWFFYLISYNVLSSVTYASLIATIVLTLASRVFAVNRRVPVTVFLIAGIFPLVPGAGIYYTAYYIFANEINTAVSKGIETIGIAIAISFGIMLVFAIPQKLFLMGKNRIKARWMEEGMKQGENKK